MSARLQRLVLVASATLLVLLTALAPVGASVARRPALGNWEGVGPHGLPLTFVLASRHGRVVASHLAIGFPLNCPGKPTPIVAVAYRHASYGGPGAPPRVRINWKPGDIVIDAVNPGEFPLTLFGRLLAHRRAVLSMGVGPRVPRHCGWPRKLITWSVRPQARLAVAAGTWTGTVTVPEGTGTVTVKVGAAGRIVDLFKVEITCDGGAGGGGGFGSGPPAEEFVSATGAFEGWGYAHWRGRFGADGVLRGSFTASDQCGTSGGQVEGAFTAQHAAG
ncbi:MAG: hypothetical protein E6G45_03625 [Actinobacteria bacterium]|nr:MAG: hypothetical protein E6G45_03625 [Actinomycetota bacterium]